MPKCKNDPKRSYTGKEPSPKGLGYCAHAEKAGTTKKGKDGNMWTIMKTKTGSQRWVKKPAGKIPVKEQKLDCSKFVRYEKRIEKHGFTEMKSIIGLEHEKGFVHEPIDFNLFEKEPIKIPEGYKKKSVKTDYIKKYWCDSSRQRLTKDAVKAKHPNSKTYFIHDNGGRPFLVYISKNEVNIYMQPDKKYFVAEKDQYNKWTYCKKVATYKKPIKVFIGKSPKTEMTKFSGGIGKKFDGNSILLQIAKDRYVSIGWFIYEFSTKNDRIKEYISPVGNSDVPYPVAISDKNVYFMLDLTYVPIDKFSKFTKDVKNDAYSYYYGHEGDEALSKYAKPMLKTKMVQKRLW